MSFTVFPLLATVAVLLANFLKLAAGAHAPAVDLTALFRGGSR